MPFPVTPPDRGRHPWPIVNAVAVLAVFAVSLVSSAAALAAWPERPIRFVLPSPAGSSPDVIMRVLLNQMSTQLGQPIVVDNKPGASYFIGTSEIARAAPDGYTIGDGNIVSLAINQSLFSKRPYDADRDLTLIANAVSVYNLLVVHPDVPVATLAELIDYLKRHPGKLTMASAGNGTTSHLGGELFKAMTGTYMLHVPYRGSPQAVNDLIGGQAQVMFDNSSSITPQIEAGRVRVLASSGPKRLAAFADQPAIGEVVPGCETVAWGGLIGPAGLPPAIVERLEKAMRQALATPAVVQALEKIQVVIDPLGPQAFRELVQRERPKWADVIRRSGAKVD